VPGLAAKLFWSTSPRSPALDRPSSPLGKAASVGGQILSCIHRRVVNYPTCGRNNVQQEKEIRKASGITALPRAYLSLRVLYLADDWQVLRPEN